jgi:hypothetical protein
MDGHVLAATSHTGVGMRTRSTTAAVAVAVVMALSALLFTEIASARPNTIGSIARSAAHKEAEPLPPVEASENCDFVADPGNSVCMLPFPDDSYTVADPSSATGRRIHFNTEATPTNVEGKHIEASPYNGAILEADNCNRGPCYAGSFTGPQ